MSAVPGADGQQAYCNPTRCSKGSHPLMFTSDAEALPSVPDIGRRRSRIAHHALGDVSLWDNAIEIDAADVRHR